VTKSSPRDSKSAAHIYIGVGGWTFAPWRGVFYPEKLTQAKELEYAASKLTSIEINGTYYGSRVDPPKAKKVPRDVFAYVIHEGKVRAPAGAMELIERVK
jgi:hypothetical protein